MSHLLFRPHCNSHKALSVITRQSLFLDLKVNYCKLKVAVSTLLRICTTSPTAGMTHVIWSQLLVMLSIEQYQLNITKKTKRDLALLVYCSNEALFLYNHTNRKTNRDAQPTDGRPLIFRRSYTVDA